MARLLYIGPDEGDDTLKKLFEDGAEADNALANGWREARKTEASAEGFDTHTANAEQVKDHIASISSLDELDALELKETDHPSFEGGRSSVLKAIDARRGELQQ